MIDYSALALPKPEARKRVKARRKRQYAKARKSCRAARYWLADGCCEDCGKPLVLDVASARSVFEIAHCHEVIPRSLGGSAVELENTRNLCPGCHLEAHGR